MNPEYVNQLAMQYAQQVNAIPQGTTGLQQLLGQIMGGSPIQHFGMIREIRKNFKQYTKEEFRHLSNEPMIKHILIGTTKLNKEQIVERIKEHLDNQ